MPGARRPIKARCAVALYIVYESSPVRLPASAGNAQARSWACSFKLSGFAGNVSVTLRRCLTVQSATPAGRPVLRGIPMLADELPQEVKAAIESAWVKNVLAGRRISFALRSSRTSRSSAFTRLR